MDRNREARRPFTVGSNGFKRRRHRTNSLRASPDEDGGVDLQESARLRDRAKKDRERERERERELRERSNKRKRRRGERLMSNFGGEEETTDESVVNDEKDGDEEEENTVSILATGGSVRVLPPAVHTRHHGHVIHHHQLSNDISFSSKDFGAVSVLKPADEMIGVFVPRKARSACTKRSNDGISSSSNNNNNRISVVNSEQILLQASSSPVRQGPILLSAPSPAASVSPSSSNASLRKKIKLSSSGGNNGLKVKSLKVSSKIRSSNPDELEIEIAEVLYGLKAQSQGPSLFKENSREVIRSSSDALNNSTPLTVVAPKRKRPRQVVESSSFGIRSSHILEKPDMGLIPKTEVSSPKFETLQKVDVELKSTVEEMAEGVDFVKEEEMGCIKGKESCLVKTEDDCRVDSTLTATSLVDVTMIKESSVVVPELENQKEKKFGIDLMAPPPQIKLTPEREIKVDEDLKPALSVDDAELKSMALKDRDCEKVVSGKSSLGNVAAEEKKVGTISEEDESKKSFESKVRNIDLGKSVTDGSAGKQQEQQLMSLKLAKEEPFIGKSGQPTNSMPLPIYMANWPDGLPPMGYMAPVQGVVSMDGSTVTRAPIQPQFSQPRPKRCATHCYIARNIGYIQQFMKINTLWTAATGTATLFGSKHFNPLVNDILGKASRDVNNAQEKGQNLANIASHGGNEKSSQLASISESVQRKQQILLQQALPPVAPSNLLGPAFIFPLNQQQATVAAAASQPDYTKSHATAVVQASSSSSAVSGSTAAGGAATAVSFNYPNMGSNETQYLAILPNNAYPFPIPAVGAPPTYRGNPAQALPLINGPFYSSQMIHPSQLQHQHPSASQLMQPQLAQQHASGSSGSSSSQKHSQSLQQRSQSSSVNVMVGSAIMQKFPNQKSQSLQQSVNQQHVHSTRTRHLENESGEDNLANIHGQNFAMPINPQNISLMTPPVASANGTSNQSERQQKQPQQMWSKAGVSSQPARSFAMSFGPMNGGASPGPGIDISMAKYQAMFQNFPDPTRQNFEMSQKNFRISEGVKSDGGDSSTIDDERKSLSVKGQGGVGQPIVLTSSDLTDTSASSFQANSIIDSSPQAMNIASGSVHRPVIANGIGAINVPNVHIQAQQMLQIQQQQQLSATASNRSKAPASRNEHLNLSSSLAAKFQNSLSGFPQNVVQSNNSSTRRPQWKNSLKTPTSHAPSPMASATVSTFKSLPPQHSQTQPQMHTQISFGSPATSSISKGSSGGLKTVPASTANKMVQASAMSTQQKSQSILANPHVSSSSSGAKPHVQQQSHLQLPKTLQQAQLLFSNPYSDVQSPQSATVSSNTSSLSGDYIPRKWPDQPHQPTQQLSGAATSVSSTGVLPLCPPVKLSSASTNDPAKAIAAATCNVKS